jgi:hypothetical protein
MMGPVGEKIMIHCGSFSGRDPTAVASKILDGMKLVARSPPSEPATADGSHADLHADHDDFFDQSPATTSRPGVGP